MAHEYGGTRVCRYLSPAALIASRVAPPPARRDRRNFDHPPRRRPRERFSAATARSPDPYLSRGRSPTQTLAFDRRTRTPLFSAWTMTPLSSACTTATAARRCVRRPRLVRSHPTWPKGASSFPRAFATLFLVLSRARVTHARIANHVADRSFLLFLARRSRSRSTTTTTTTTNRPPRERAGGRLRL